MGSIEALTEKPRQEADIMFDSHQIARLPTYSTVNINDETGKVHQMSDSKSAQTVKTVFEQEFERFCDELSTDPKQKKKLEFFERIKVQNAMAAPGSIQDSVEHLARTCGDKKLRRVYGAFVPLVEALKDYTAVIDTMVQAYPMPLALIWGGLKIVLDCAGRYSQQFEKIKAELQRLPDILWDLSGCEDIYGTSPYGADVVRRAICASYRTIFKFWYRSAKILEHPKRYVLIENRKLSGLVFDLQRNWETLSKIRDGVEAQLNHEMREKIAVEARLAEGMRQGLTDEFIKTALERSATQIERVKAEEERLKAEADRVAAQKDRELAETERQNAAEERVAAEEERKKAHLHRVTDLTWKGEQNRFQAGTEMRSLMARIESRDHFSFGIFNSVLKERHPGTCEWLFEHEIFQTWAAEESKSPVLWLNGKHGAGKSFLCASAIDFIRGSPPSKRVAFQFLTKDQYIPRTQLLRNLAYQLLDCLIVKSVETPASLEPFLQINKDDSGSLERLIHFVLLELPFTYIFIDGLDEADYTEGQLLSPAHRYNKDVPDFVTFLIQEAVQFPGKLRLWCSSQPLPGVQDYLCQPEWKDVITEIPLQIEDTADDIQRYLLAAVPDTTPDTTSFARTLITSTIATDVEGSFLWASSMLRDLKDEAEDTDDLIRLANEGLPREMSGLYTKAINRMKKQDGNKKLPLWKIVLSLLTFARRPLRVSEIIEAVAMIRTPKGENLSDNKRVDPRKILNGCLSLVRHIKIDCNYQNDILHLSHSAVRTYLLKNSDKADVAPNEADQFVTSRIIQDSCLQYLCQPRYRKLLDKDSYGVFWTDDDEDVRSHRLLSYAAKYWYQHFDTPEDKFGPITPEPADKNEVTNFLKSPSFQTCLQVQSLFVIGHFIQRCDPITDQIKTVRKTLPNWMPREEIDLHRQYLEFQGEWTELLQCGQSRQFNGELDRCFWNTLGSANFLSQSTSRYQSFQFKQINDGGEGESRCQIQQLSSDGKTLMTGWVHKQGESQELHLEQWMIDGVNAPKLSSETIIPFSADDTQLDLYSLPCSKTFHSFPLIPNTSCVVPPDAIFIADDSALRIGSKLFGSRHGAQKMEISVLKDRALGDSWESVSSMGPYLITCRRRFPRPQPSATSQAKERLGARQAQERASEFRARGHSQRGDSDHDSESSDEEDEHDSDSSGEDSVADDSAEESWSEGSDTEDTSENDSDFAEAEESGSEGSGDELDLDEPKKSVSSRSDIKSEPTADSDDESGDSDPDSAKSVVSFDDVADDSSSDSDDSIQSDTSERSLLDPELVAREEERTQYPVGITRVQGSKICDGCNKDDVERYLHCLICQDNDFDICNACERRGRWCFEQKHQMYRVVDLKFAGVVASRMNFNIKQELNVFRTDLKGKKMRVFRLRRNYNSMLHDSPPSVHPKHPLVVWAITGDRLLFADFEANTFFQQNLDTTSSKKARPICVDLSFSPCHGFLRVASIEAVVERPTGSRQNRRSRKSGVKPSLCLYMHVMVLRLSSSKPTKIPPKMVATTSFRLGCDMKPHVQELPFAFTWSATELYLTVSHARLRVYRITLPSAVPKSQGVPSTTTSAIDAPMANEFKIMAPKECIFLPRSSRNRSVQFFPPDAPGANSVVIIGPRHDKHPTPPICVYLKDQDLGSWVPIEDKEGESMLHMPQKRLQGQFEEFDEEQDCDLIPYD